MIGASEARLNRGFDGVFAMRFSRCFCHIFTGPVKTGPPGVGSPLQRTPARTLRLSGQVLILPFCSLRTASLGLALPARAIGGAR